MVTALASPATRQMMKENHAWMSTRAVTTDAPTIASTSVRRSGAVSRLPASSTIKIDRTAIAEKPRRGSVTFARPGGVGAPRSEGELCLKGHYRGHNGTLNGVSMASNGSLVLLASRAWPFARQTEPRAIYQFLIMSRTVGSTDTIMNTGMKQKMIGKIILSVSLAAFSSACCFFLVRISADWIRSVSARATPCF